jgi:acyl carrier protein
MKDDQLFRVIAEAINLPLNQVTPGLTMQDTEAWDSLKHMELIVALEAACKIDLTFEEIVQMRSVAAIKRVLAARGVEVDP